MARDPEPAPPWTYNPSAWRHRVPIGILAALATVISAYLALYQWRLIDTVWDPVFGHGADRDPRPPHARDRRRRLAAAWRSIEDVHGVRSAGG